MITIIKPFLWAASLAVLTTITACGGGSSGSEPAPASPPPNADPSPSPNADPSPSPVDDSFTVEIDGSLDGNVASNDNVLGLGALTYVVTVAPSHGVLDLNNDGNFSYTPANGFQGEDTFSYSVTEADGDIGNASVIITVINDEPSDWQLVWADEFNGETIDPENWEHQVFAGVSSGNDELQYYTARPQNSRIEDDPEDPSSSNRMLVIEAHQESPRYLNHDYSSARLHTVGKQDFLYGRFEARIKIPSGQGYWPAFWMLPTDWVYGGWAASGEIDIMEAVNVANSTHGTLHYGGEWPGNQYSGCEYNAGGGVNFSDDFHTYAVEWEPSEFRWYVDGNLFCTRTSDSWFSSNGPTPAPFDQRFHILLNVAVGGTWPGSPSASTVFPQKMWVDYVRVSQIANEQPTVNLTFPTTAMALPSGTNTLLVSAADTDGTIDRVKFYANGSFLAEDTTEPYSYDWNTADDCYEVRVDAIDNLGGLASAAATDITVGEGCPTGPFIIDTPASVPGIVQAEDFDRGPAGVAYSDDSSGNAGNAYRTDVDVDIEVSSAGGFNVGWITDDEFMTYTVDVTSAGDYDIGVSVASLPGGGVFHIEFNGVDVTGPMTAPSTGDWQAWSTVSATITLSQGEQVMRFVAETAGFNLDFFNITAN